MGQIKSFLNSQMTQTIVVISIAMFITIGVGRALSKSLHLRQQEQIDAFMHRLDNIDGRLEVVDQFYTSRKDLE